MFLCSVYMFLHDLHIIVCDINKIYVDLEYQRTDRNRGLTSSKAGKLKKSYASNDFALFILIILFLVLVLRMKSSSVQMQKKETRRTRRMEMEKFW